MEQLSIIDIRSDLLPGLQSNFGEIRCHSANGLLSFVFSSEENTLRGYAFITDYFEKAHRCVKIFQGTGGKTLIVDFRRNLE